MKIPSAKGAPKVLADIRRSFGAIPGIEEIVTNPVTASCSNMMSNSTMTFMLGSAAISMSITLNIRRSLDPRPPATKIDAFVNKIEEEADFLAEHSHAAKAVVEFCRHCDHQIKLGSGNTFDLKMALCVGIVGIMIFEIGAPQPPLSG
jgi:hypothetical protein